MEGKIKQMKGQRMPNGWWAVLIKHDQEGWGEDEIELWITDNLVFCNTGISFRGDSAYIAEVMKEEGLI